MLSRLDLLWGSIALLVPNGAGCCLSDSARPYLTLHGNGLRQLSVSVDTHLTQCKITADAGVDDVLAPPHDFDVMTARITRSVRGLSRRRAPGPPGGFNASFEAFSFIDLIQSLGQSPKSVRIDLRNGSGEEGVIFMDRGRMVYAACGGLLGEEAAPDTPLSLCRFL